MYISGAICYSVVMPLYHYQVGFPKNIALAPLFNLRPSVHAREEAVRDPRGVIVPPVHFLPRVAKVIEIETDLSDEVIKILARQKYDVQNDVVYSIATKDKIIKTVWLTHRNDNHRTLDRSRYDRPQ